MQLAHCTWPFVDNYLKSGSGIVIPLGSTEQHGPNGLIGTDAICAENIAWQAANRCGAMVAPTVALTPAQFNLAFPGTISLRASTLMAVLEDVILSLAKSGFRKFYFLNGHGANIAVVRNVCHDIYQSTGVTGDAATLDFRCKSWWEFPEVDALRQSLFDNREGMHATPSEVSITRALHPELFGDSPAIDYQSLPEKYFSEHAGDSHKDATRHRQQFPDGCVGSDPAMASAGHGEHLLNVAVEAVAEDYMEYLNQEL